MYNWNILLLLLLNNIDAVLTVKLAITPTMHPPASTDAGKVAYLHETLDKLKNRVVCSSG